MANTTIALTRKQIRQSISRLLSINSPYSIIAGAVASATSSTVVVSKLQASPQTDTSLYVGSLLYITSGTGSGSQPYFVTDFAPTTGTLTVVPSFSVTPDTTSQVEIYDPRKWSKDQIEDAIDLAFWDSASRLLWPTESVPLAFESILPQSLTNSPSTNSRASFRTEYPIPTQYLWLNEVDYDLNNPITGWGQANWTGTGMQIQSIYGSLLSSFQTKSALLQEFSTPANQWVSHVAMYLYQPNGNVGNNIHAFIRDYATGSVVAVSQIRSTADIAMSPSMVVFPLATPALLTPGNRYLLGLEYVGTNGAPLLSSTNLASDDPSVFWATDTAGGFLTASGGAGPWFEISTGNLHTDTIPDAVFNYIFQLYDVPNWKPLNHDNWSIVPSDNYSVTTPTDYGVTADTFSYMASPKVHFDSGTLYPEDGTLMRFRGARAPQAFDQTAATDTTVPEVDPAFLIYKAASILATQRLPSPQMTADAIQAQADLWGKQSEQHRQPYSIPPGAMRRVR